MCRVKNHRLALREEVGKNILLLQLVTQYKKVCYQFGACLETSDVYWAFLAILIGQLKNWTGNGGEKEGVTCRKWLQGGIEPRAAEASVHGSLAPPTEPPGHLKVLSNVKSGLVSTVVFWQFSSTVMTQNVRILVQIGLRLRKITFDFVRV